MPSLTINFSTAHATRIQAALEQVLRLEDENGEPRAATLVDLKNYVVRDVKQLVRTAEKRVARRAAEAVIADVDLT